MNAHPSRGRTGFLRSGMCPAVERKMVGSELDRPSAMRHACARRAPMRRSRGRDQAGRLTSDRDADHSFLRSGTAACAAVAEPPSSWGSLGCEASPPAEPDCGVAAALAAGLGSRDATDDMFTDTQPRYGLAHVAHTRRGRALVQGLHVIGQPDKWLVAQSHQSPLQPRNPVGWARMSEGD